MNTHKYLKQIENADRLIDNKLAELYRWKVLTSSISVASDGERVQTSGNKDRMGSIVARIADLEKEIDNAVDDLIDKKTMIISQINGMENSVYSSILHGYYVEYLTFTEIRTEKIPYSRSRMNILYKEAMHEFERAYGHTYLNK